MIWSFLKIFVFLVMVLALTTGASYLMQAQGGVDGGTKRLCLVTRDHVGQLGHLSDGGKLVVVAVFTADIKTGQDYQWFGQIQRPDDRAHTGMCDDQIGLLEQHVEFFWRGIGVQIHARQVDRF